MPHVLQKTRQENRDLTRSGVCPHAPAAKAVRRHVQESLAASEDIELRLRQWIGNGRPVGNFVKTTSCRSCKGPLAPRWIGATAVCPSNVRSRFGNLAPKVSIRFIQHSFMRLKFHHVPCMSWQQLLDHDYGIGSRSGPAIPVIDTCEESSVGNLGLLLEAMGSAWDIDSRSTAAAFIAFFFLHSLS